MSGRAHSFVLSLLLALPASALAAPATLQFDGALGPGYLESGFVLQTSDPVTASVDGVPAPSLNATVAAQGFTLVAEDGRGFDLHAIGLAELDPLAGPLAVNFEGDRRGGGTVSLTLTTDGTVGFERLVFPSRFSDLVALRWNAGPELLLDAVELSSGLDLTRLVSGSRTYVEDGLLLRASTVLDATVEGTPAPALAGPAFGETHTLAPVDGGHFAVTRVQGRASVTPASASITFVGTLADGGTVSTTFVTDGAAIDFATFDFPAEFVDLVRLQWSDAPDFVIDSIETAFDPALNVSVEPTHDGSATVFVLPDGNGRPLSGALTWNGVIGSSPQVVDATIRARVAQPDGSPAAGVELALRSSAGNVTWCDGGDRFDAPSDADGLTAFASSPRAGGASDVDAGERMEVHVPDHPGSRVVYAPRLIASRNDGNLYAIDPVTGVATALCVGTLPAGATEIAYERSTGTLWVQPPGLGFVVVPYDLQSCSTSGPSIDNGAAMNGLEFVGDELYGVGITSPCGASSLYRIDVAAGTTTLVGPTGLPVPVAGLAFDVVRGVMYGVTGCTSSSGSDLVTIDLASGEALVVGSLGVALGSIAHGADGALYGVGNNQNGGLFYRIDPSAVAVTPLGASGVGGLTGLALVSGSSLDLRVHGADLDGDLDVDLADIGEFAVDLASYAVGGPAAFRSDFFLNGQINLQDIGEMGTGVGAICPTLAPGSAVALSSDSRVGIWFDANAPVRSVRAPAGEILTAHLVLEGPLAREDVRAWAVRLRTSANVETIEWDLPAGSIDFGRDDVRIVGTGSARGGSENARVLATFTVRVRDEFPATFELEGVPAVAHGSDRPAIAHGESGTIVVVEGAFGHGVAVAAINGEIGARTDAVGAFAGHAVHNTPNPFNPSTVIHFALPESGRADVRIYDLAGRIVRRLEAGARAEGRHAVRWDGRDARGRAVTSGVYLARLYVDDRAVGNVAKLALVE